MKVIERIKKFWNETLGPDYPDAESAELSINSTDPIIAELARSQKHVDDKVNNYGNSGRAQRNELLKATKVKPQDLIKESNETKNLKSKNHVKDNDREIGE